MEEAKGLRRRGEGIAAEGDATDATISKTSKKTITRVFSAPQPL